jgi:imidazolonepropionase-like amidohydrolase
MIPRLFLAALLLPAVSSGEVLALRGATVHTAGDAGVLEGATIVIRDGRIAAVGAGLPIPAGATVVEAAGKVITPGLVDAYGRLGVEEIEQEESTVDAGFKGLPYSAAFDIAPAVNPRSVRIEVNRSEGITSALVAPAARAGSDGIGPVLAGQAALVRLLPGGEAEVRPGAGMVFPYGSAGASLSGGSRAAALLRLREALEDARDYAAHRRAFDEAGRRTYALGRLDLEALQPLLAGRMPLLAQADRESDIRTLVAFAREQGIRLVIVGGAEAWRAAGTLAANDVPVILDAFANLPKDFDSLDATLENAARLERAGVAVAFATSDHANPRNVRQLAGNAVRHGMSPQAALAAITRVPGSLFSGPDGLGSLTAGAPADLVVWDGDPLEVTTLAEQVYVGGQPVPAASRQTRLRDRYRNLGPDLPPAYRKP